MKRETIQEIATVVYVLLLSSSLPLLILVFFGVIARPLLIDLSIAAALLPFIIVVPIGVCELAKRRAARQSSRRGFEVIELRTRDTAGNSE
jgi:hypothetical protein